MNPSWDTLERSRQARLERAAPWARGREVAAGDVGELLHALLEPGDKVCLEGNNQKQADFLAQALADLDPARVHDLHMVQSVLSLPSHWMYSSVASRRSWTSRSPARSQCGWPTWWLKGASRSVPSTPTWNCSAATSST